MKRDSGLALGQLYNKCRIGNLYKKILNSGFYWSWFLYSEFGLLFSGGVGGRGATSHTLSGVLSADFCTDHVHYVKNHRSMVLRRTVLWRNKNMAAQGRTVSHYYILVIRIFFIWCRFSDIVCGFLFLLNNFPLQSLEYATYSCA